MHHKIPKIEQYANEDEWVEGTLIEEISEPEKMEKDMKYLKKTLTWTLLDNRIKSMDEIIIELGHDPKDAKDIKALMKKKEEDIATLRKYLKLPPSMHPQTAEVVQQKSEEDVMDLLMKLNERLTDIEQALEKVLKEK